MGKDVKEGWEKEREKWREIWRFIPGRMDREAENGSTNRAISSTRLAELGLDAMLRRLEGHSRLPSCHRPWWGSER